MKQNWEKKPYILQCPHPTNPPAARGTGWSRCSVRTRWSLIHSRDLILGSVLGIFPEKMQLTMPRRGWHQRSPFGALCVALQKPRSALVASS